MNNIQYYNKLCNVNITQNHLYILLKSFIFFTDITFTITLFNQVHNKLKVDSIHPISKNTMKFQELTYGITDLNIQIRQRNHQYKLFFNYQRQRPYHVEYTGSRPITEVKQHRARIVLGWVTAWEHRVLLSFCHLQMDP